MTTTLSSGEARRIFLDAQGMARGRPRGRVGDAQFGAYLARQGVLQLDTVNVLARAHYLPLFSRFGPYATDALDTYLWGDAEGHSAHCFEHWGHEASVMPRSLLPVLHHRMAGPATWKERTQGRLERERPGLIEAVLAAVEADGPLTAGEIDHLAPRGAAHGGSWWDHGHVKDALEYLFITGHVAASRRGHFARTYDATERAWGRQPVGSGDWGLAPDDARQALFDHAIAAVGIGTPKDIADHFRLKPGGAAQWAASAVERGLATWATVEGWNERALLAMASSGREARDPGRSTGAALLSPFDPVCWYRPRLERMFGMEYRIEIYTPEAKRLFGYYTLPFLLGDQMVGRFDLKADRKAKALLVQSSWREERPVPGARRRSDGDIAAALAGELSLMARWLGLDRVEVAPRGNLAGVVASAVAASGTA